MRTKQLGPVCLVLLQGFALATFFGAMLYRDTPPTFNMIILVAIFLQALVCGLVLLGR